MDRKIDKKEMLSVIIYFFNKWGKGECDYVFGDMSGHMWNKWVECEREKGMYGAVTAFVLDLDYVNEKKLIDRACELFHGRKNKQPNGNDERKQAYSDVFNFIALCLPDYYHRQIVADEQDIYKVLTGEMEEQDRRDEIMESYGNDARAILADVINMDLEMFKESLEAYYEETLGIKPKYND